MSALTIRDFTPGDRAAWDPLWQGYLTFYKVDIAPEVTERTWARLMDPASPLSGRFVCDGDKVLGFAHHHTHCSTWAEAEACYLEDLYVSEDARGKGAGRALLDDLKTIVQANGWSRLYWHTDTGNARARALYDSYNQADTMVRYSLRF